MLLVNTGARGSNISNSILALVIIKISHRQRGLDRSNIRLRHGNTRSHIERPHELGTSSQLVTRRFNDSHRIDG